MIRIQNLTHYYRTNEQAEDYSKHPEQPLIESEITELRLFSMHRGEMVGTIKSER